MNWLIWLKHLFAGFAGGPKATAAPSPSPWSIGLVSETSPKSSPPRTKESTAKRKSAPVESKASEWRADERSERNLATLEPVTARLAREHLRRLVEMGLNFKVTSGRRTFAEQAKLYAQGRTAPGARVTNARPGYSWHNFGTAYDLTLFSGKNPVWESRHYDTAGRIGEELGLEWGGRWKKFVDRPHFQRKLGMSLAEARQRYPQGQIV